MSHKQRWK